MSEKVHCLMGYQQILTHNVEAWYEKLQRCFQHQEDQMDIDLTLPQSGCYMRQFENYDLTIEELSDCA